MYYTEAATTIANYYGTRTPATWVTYNTTTQYTYTNDTTNTTTSGAGSNWTIDFINYAFSNLHKRPLKAKVKINIAKLLDILF